MSSNPMHRTLLQVALPTPLYRHFDYLCPTTITQLPAIGTRVQVPFGRQKLIGIVIGHTDHSDISHDKLKSITACLDDTPIIDGELLRLAYWLASYYHYPLGETLSVMLPTLINQGQNVNDVAWQLSQNGQNSQFAQKHITKTAKKQWLLYDTIKTSSPIAQRELLIKHSKATIKALADKDIIEPVAHTEQTAPNLPPPSLLNTPLTANDEQQSALDDICQVIDDNRYQGFLLNGITGSGKTEVYLQAMWHALAKGKQVLILVPEIGLTPQTKARFSSRFCANICVLHSGMTDGERLSGWQDCRSGAAQIIIGTRSSILYPFANLGLVIIDEAHDSSYKQQDHLRYHACDVAMWRAYHANIPVILGTATPSLEQLKLVQDGKLHEHHLQKRAGNASISTLIPVDLRLGTRHITQSDGNSQQTLLSDDSIRHIKHALEQGEQVLLFLNRRGYAPILLCDACGWQADCPRCDAHLTLHKYPFGYLKCHHCGYQTHPPTHCPECHSQNLGDLGLGTSKLSEQLHAIFGNPQTSHQTYPIWQIDRDTMRKKGAWEAMYQQILTGEPAILVGTQMIAKGHHFPSVTLVVVVDADLGFLSPNFRSPEHTAQRIIQVAGRAGREQKAGKVLIQTKQPQNPLLTTLIKGGYLGFAHLLMQERKVLGLPPFSHAALINAESPNQDKARHAIGEIGKRLPCLPNLRTTGATDAPLAKKNNRYHTQLLLFAKDRKTLHQALSDHWATFCQLPSSRGVKLSLDIDPMDC